MKTNRCENELPQTSNPANCDAIPCDADATYLTEAGWRCASCFREFGGVLVIDADEPQHSVSPLWRLANVQAAAELDRRNPQFTVKDRCLINHCRDLGTLMSNVIDSLTDGGVL